MTHKQNLKKNLKKKKPPQKQSRELHTCNSLDGRFDKDFYYGFPKHQIAYVIRKKKTKKQTKESQISKQHKNCERMRIIDDGGEKRRRRSCA